ncbi:acetolactate synthase, large subunit [Pseudarcicella hirudinis]|uniref:Acetolactate synthase n=1 Tax=Pseudarcicella hirudinis TaxID=1079859 RepID=A0A1I5QYD6_9BACT|nr:biosynthetic-type acetolactate synthase large subunit [Pseudarcicella hirudinis]SFP51288.1 acetolactate synthase, large subunit [Pseudarcicella hirudinis]
MAQTQTMTEEATKTEADKYLTGAQAIMQCLVEQGVDTIFGYPGGAIMPTYDALYDYQDRIKHILVRHEQGAGHAAQGYARMTNRAGVAMVTSGPGATNMMTPIADAMLDSTPMVCLVGQVKANLLGTDAFQECDIIGMSMPITKWNYQVVDANEIPEVMAKAFHIAESGRPGPVLIDLTRTAQADKMTIPFSYKKEVDIISYRPRLIPKQEHVEAAAKLINAAKKPYIFAGHGILISQAQEELDAFLVKTDIPVATTLLGMSAVSFDHPNYVGWLGMHGNYGANILTDETDLVIAIGMRFDDRVTGDLEKYIKQAKVVHIDVDPAEINKNINADAPVVGDARETLKALLPLVKENKHTEWRAEFKKYDEIEFEKISKKDLFHEGDHIKMGEAVAMLSKKTKGEAVTVTDVGQHQMIVNRYYEYKKWNSLVTSGGAGTMGFALPAAFGAKVGAPDREVVAIIGDGGFQMTLQELGTIAQSGLPVKIIILNNNFLGMVRQWQALFFDKRYSFVELQNPDFITIAKGFGISGHTVSDRGQLSESLDTLLNSDKPYLLEIICEKEENVFPMVPAGASVAAIRLE